ncbi:MAG: hemolysin family protein [Isosphaeraceae bacterium]
MTGIYLASIVVLGAPLLILHLLSVTLTRALRTYSRSRLTELCQRQGRAGLAVEIAQRDESTEEAAELLAVITGLMLAALLGITVNRRVPTFAVESIVAIALAIGSVGYVFSGVVGRVFAERVLGALWPTAAPLRWAMFPLNWSIRQVERMVENLADPRDSGPRPASVEVEIPVDEVHAQDVHTDFPESARELLRHAVTLTHRDVFELMTPRARLVWLPATVSASVAARVFHDTGKSRIPLYGENHDDVVGVLYAKDLFAALTASGGDEAVIPRKLARRAFCVPETKNAYAMLGELRAKRTQIAIVVDEYGGVAGVVTLEDLLEALVGDIDDEHDVPTPADPVSPLGGSRFAVDAELTVEELNDRLGLHFPTDEGFTTVGGLAFTTLGRVPEPGATFRVQGVEFQVAEVAEHAIRRLTLDLQPAERVGSS